jgi:hypothetical protein
MSVEIIGSKLKAKNGYGQNGFQGASSDLPGEKTKTGGGFAPAASVPGDGWQTRKVSAKQDVPTHPASRDVNANPKTVPAKIDRRK